jgi:cation-transporting ATPase 13A2
MSPDQKQRLVEQLQAIGYCVSFCGDGANDCGALKAADVGISLSQAEASIAAPFTSKITDISCVLEVVREGRAALVTSFSSFKFMALYSMIQFGTACLLVRIGSNLGKQQYVYIDLFLSLPIAILMSRFKPSRAIVPKRPTATLLSMKLLTSLFGQVFVQVLFQTSLYLFTIHQQWFTPIKADDEDLTILSYENTTLFTFSTFQYLIVALIYCAGKPYRTPMHSNSNSL